MSAPAQSNLEQVFANVASNYRGADIDLHAVYREMREKSPVLPENFMARLGVPSIAGLDPDRPVFTLFKYDDVMAVMRDATNFTSGFIAEGLGSFFDGLILTAMENYLAPFGAWVTVTQGAIFVLCVLAFRRGMIGELGTALRLSL